MTENHSDEMTATGSWGDYRSHDECGSLMDPVYNDYEDLMGWICQPCDNPAGDLIIWGLTVEAELSEEARKRVELISYAPDEEGRIFNSEGEHIGYEPDEEGRLYDAEGNLLGVSEPEETNLENLHWHEQGGQRILMDDHGPEDCHLRPLPSR